jgi:NADH:ubiquinone oxidoreductase subunit 3 (subunit A)
MTLLLQLLFGSCLTFLIGFIQLKTAEFTLKRTKFFKYRYRDQCEATLSKVMFLLVAPLTILFEISITLFFEWSTATLINGIGASTFSFLIVLLGVYGRHVINRFDGYYVKRAGKTLITRDVISQPTEAEIDILASGKRITSKLCM